MKKIVSLVILAAAAAAIAYGMGRWGTCGASSSPSLDRLRDVQWLKGALGLTESQAAEISTLQTDYVSEMESCCASHCAARMNLGELLFKAGADEASIGEAVEAMCKAQSAGDRATLEHIRKVHQLLTPDQRTRYEQLVTGCVCAACPNRFDHVVSAQ